ncbi:hypothetical protein LG291_01645 [Cytobacillus firmus]|uniref:hypothetical protein n=1 Tax=Cytobacillus firmus TaxID=1399 RepID=UPI00384B7110
MRSPEFFKELGVTALGQILPPGAYSIWAIWQSTYERKTIRYQLTALKALAELNSSEISPESFIYTRTAGLSGNSMEKKEKPTNSSTPFQKTEWAECGNWTP